MSGVIEEDIDMGNPSGPGEGNGVYVDKAVLEKLLLALSSKSSQSIRVREPDVFRGDRSAIAVASWLGSLECYFELVPLKEKEKVSFAVTLLRDDALIWWNQLKVSRVPPSDWSSFKFAFENEFRPVNSTQAARDKLAILSQHSTVARYISEFRSLQLQIPDMSAGDALDRFVRGLKPDLRVLVRSRFPHSLESAESMALAIEAARNDGEMASAPVVHTPSGNPFARGSPLGAPGNGEDPMDLDSIRQVLNAISTAFNGKGRKGFERSNNGRRQIRCYGCQGIGHVKSECPTWRKAGNSRTAGSGSSRQRRTINCIKPVKHCECSDNKMDASDLDGDDEFLARDHDHLLNLNNNKESDLPLYEFVLCDNNNVDKCRKVKVLLDTGASANYISPKLVNSSMKMSALRSSREVETAGGHVMPIDKKVEFELRARQIPYHVQAYVFDMKFDLILGQQWFQQAKPIPNWSTSSWRLVDEERGNVLLTPCDDTADSTIGNGDQDFVYLISKRQLQRSTTVGEKTLKTSDIFSVFSLCEHV